MDSETTNTPRERNFAVLLAHPHKVNEPWLEDQAIRLEEALIRDCGNDVLGPSVTANFHENGFEIDLTVEASSLSEAYDKLGRAMTVIENVAGVSIEPNEADEVRSSFASQDRGPHKPAVLT